MDKKEKDITEEMIIEYVKERMSFRCDGGDIITDPELIKKYRE